MFRKENLPEGVKLTADHLRDNGHKVFLVGGAVRDLMRGVEPKDYDLATDAVSSRLLDLFNPPYGASGYSVGNGVKHGTVVVVWEGCDSVEVTTFRKDVFCDGRHAEVEFTDDLYKDLSRRDFTMNAMAMDLVTGEVVDPFNGTEDLRGEVVRAVGNPSHRFREDWLRMVRVCRFCALSENFVVDYDTARALRRLAVNVVNVAPERLMQEMLKMMTYDVPSNGLRWMQNLGLLVHVLPEVAALVGVQQNRWHELYMCSECGREHRLMFDRDGHWFEPTGR
jgi:tRNA nucleotidyltransferase/poly(A) polymerase